MSQYNAFYNDRRWKRLRARHLAEHPLCTMCKRSGQVSEATVVDHIVPHKGDRDLFWTRTICNLSAWCITTPPSSVRTNAAIS